MEAAKGAVEGLGGKRVSSGEDKLEAKFDKKILGKVLAERTQLALEVVPAGDQIQVHVTAYPLDAIRRPLQFGFRKGVTQTVANWFIAHLEHRLPEQ